MSLPLSIAIIAKNNADTLRQLFDSLKPIGAHEIIFVDTGSTDNSKDIATEYGAKVFDFEWCNNFSKARTFAYAQCTQDWIMWVDTDDVVINGERIKDIFPLLNSTIDGVILPYWYIVDEQGNVLNEQKRTRITRKGLYEWKGAVHEDILPLKENNRLCIEDVIIKHTSFTGNTDAHVQKLERNLAILEHALDEEKKAKKLDARTVLYYGHTLFGMNRFDEAREAYITYSKMSGWEEDLYTAYIRLAICDRELGDYDKSVESIQMAWCLDPLAPEAYLQLGQTYMKLGLHKKAIQAADAVIRYVDEKYKRDTTSFPMDYVWYPLLIKADSYLALNKHEEALKYYIQLKEKKFNKQQNIDEVIANISQIINEQHTVKKYYAQSLELKTDEERKALYNSIPVELRSYPSVIEIKKSFSVKKESSGKDVVFMCGYAYEEWTPDSIHTTGIGGSEEAVINMAKELHTMGYNVTIYNTIMQEKTFDGVVYKPWWEFNPKDKCDFFIGWRFETIFDQEINATKKYLWLHDVVQEEEYTPERLKNIDKILVLSHYHRTNLPSIPDEKFFITSNGVDISLFEKEVKRKPFSMIYTSSYDRGLQQLLEMWKDIKKEIPEATLDIYYGWGNFDIRYADNPERKLWKQYMVSLMQQDGVKEHGRVSHQKIATAMLSSEIWAYPTTWLETNCITGLKAQMAGCIPVTIGLGALPETVHYGKTLNGDYNIYTNEGKKAYIVALKEVAYTINKYDRVTMQSDMKQKYSWSAIAKSWEKELFT